MRGMVKNMKKIVVISIFLTIFALAFSMTMGITNTIAGAQQQLHEPDEAENDIENTPDIPNAKNDNDVSVRLLISGQVETIPMGDYLCGVVSAEMPASFELEAMKAQVVAARTYTLHKIHVEPTHENADVCADSTCCKAYNSASELMEKWGSDYSAYTSKVAAAVSETDGVYLKYGGEPILAVFHSSSSGQTETSDNVWGKALPYLKSVYSPETEEEVPNYISSVTVSHEDFKETLRANWAVSFGDDPGGWVENIVYTDSGRIDTVSIGGIAISGKDLRALFQLRSTAVQIQITENDVVFVTTGYGHGVGMSQYGANALAKEGRDYVEILNWYYADVEYGSIADIKS